MPAGPYRDALAAARERVQLLEAEVARRTARVSPVQLALVPEELAIRVDELRAQVAARPAPTLAAWTERERGLEDLVAALDETAARAPILEAPAEAPLPPESSDPRPFLMDELRHQRLRRQVEKELSSHARDVRCARWSDEAYLWKFELERVRMNLYGAARVGSLAEEIDVELVLYTSVPAEIGPLALTPADWWDRNVGGRWGDTIALDSDFARYFLVRGPARQARALLPDAVRALLVALHRFAPRLELLDGEATLWWKLRDIAYDEPTFGVVHAALALIAMRRLLE